MTHFIEVSFIALMLSSTYILIAVGFTLFFGAINIVHFAHGDVAMLGAFVAIVLYAAADTLGLIGGTPIWVWAPLLALAIGIASGGFGLLFERVVIRPFRASPMLITLVATVALGIVVREAVRLFYPQGSNPQVFPNLFGDSGLRLGELYFRTGHLVMFAVSLLLILAMVGLIWRTRIGLVIRTVSQNIEAASLSGIDPDKVIMITFLIGSILAGAAGVLIGSYYSMIKFDVGLMYGIKGFSAAVVGGLGNFHGAILGGLTLGLIETFASAYIPEGMAYKDVYAFVIVIFFLVFRPAGILAEKQYDKV